MKKQSSLFDFLSKAPAKRKAENEDTNDSPKKVMKVEKKVFDVEEIEDVCCVKFVLESKFLSFSLFR